MSAVAELYDRWANFQERRLSTMPCEQHVHLAMLERHLAAGSRVLDIGAGPGQYALELMRRGHRLVVADLSQAQVELARSHLAQAGYAAGSEGPLEALRRLDARELRGLDDQGFDAVISFGPFYHLKLADDRDRAAREACRVLEPGGLLFAAFMPRPYWLGLALHRFIAEGDVQDPAADRQLERLENLLEHGELEGVRSPQLRHGWFVSVEEITPFFARHGFEPLALVASSGVSGPWSRQEIWQRLDQRPPEIRRRVLDLLLQTASDPHVLALSDQVLFVGRRSAPGQPSTQLRGEPTCPP